MEARRQVIRYAIAGGYALMIAAFYEATFGIAWKEQVEGLIPVSRADAFTTIGGAVAVGFVLYQLYSALDRPRMQIEVRLPWRSRGAAGGGSRRGTVRLALFGKRDASGAVLDALREIPTVERALRHAYGTQAGEGEREQNADVLCSVLNLTYSSGDGQIARSYAALEDIYHALGACHAALVAISAATFLDILAAHGHTYVAHLGASIGVTVISLLLIWGSHRVIAINRRRRWNAMTHQLRNDLRAWALRHPQLLGQLAEGDGEG